MKSYTTDEFWELYRALSQNIRRQAQKAHEQFESDPFIQVCISKRWIRNGTYGQHELLAAIVFLAFGRPTKLPGFGLAHIVNTRS